MTEKASKKTYLFADFARGSISRQIPCSGRKGAINSLLARNNFPARLHRESSSQIAEFAEVFETDFRKRRLISAKFPAFFPATREFWPPGDCRIDRRRAAE